MSADEQVGEVEFGAAGGIVDLDPVDQHEGLVALGTANAHLGEGADRALRLTATPGTSRSTSETMRTPRCSSSSPVMTVTAEPTSLAGIGTREAETTTSGPVSWWWRLLGEPGPGQGGENKGKRAGGRQAQAVVCGH